MNIEKSSGNCRVLDSGTAISFDVDSSICFELSFDQTFQFNVELKFSKTDGGQRKLSKNVDERNKLITITCVNFDNPLGTGTTTPIELATYKTKKIYLHLWVYSLGENSVRKVEYCYYIEK